jgi:signal transduction histidine kinase
LRPRILLGTAVAIGAAVTLLVAVAPTLPFAYQSPGLRVALEAEAGLVALLAAHLVLGRFRRDHRVRDLGVSASLALFGATSLFLATLPAAFTAQPQERFVSWAAVAGRLLATTLLAVAAVAPAGKFRADARDTAAVLGALAVALVSVAGVVAVLGSSFPLGIDPAGTSSAELGADPTGHPAVAVAQLLILALSVLAAVGFARQAWRDHDDFAGWLAGGATLAAFASLQYLLFPSLHAGWVYTGDILRFSFYVMLLAAAAQEVGRHWRGLALAAVLDERRRVARDLHDGLAQELAFIGAQSRRLSSSAQNGDALAAISVAAERALDESRRAILALTRPLDEPLAIVLADTAREVAARAGLRLECQLEDGILVPPATREALVRIMREAITNAARHGRASMARVELTNGSGVRLRVTDDGVGFDPATARSAGYGFGLTSIEERTRQLGGFVRIDSSPQGGTSIDVVLPRLAIH